MHINSCLQEATAKITTRVIHTRSYVDESSDREGGGKEGTRVSDGGRHGGRHAWRIYSKNLKFVRLTVHFGACRGVRMPSTAVAVALRRGRSGVSTFAAPSEPPRARAQARSLG